MTKIYFKIFRKIFILPVNMKNIVIRTNPVDGIENMRDDINVSGSMAKPNATKVTNAGVKSLIVDHPSSWNANNVIIKIITVKMNVAKSNRNDVVQNVETFSPLTNCSSFALETLSLM